MIENPPPPGQASAKLQEVHEVFMKFLEAKISGSDDDLCGVLYGIGKGFVDLTPKLPRWIDSPNTLEAHARYDFEFLISKFRCKYNGRRPMGSPKKFPSFPPSQLGQGKRVPRFP